MVDFDSHFAGITDKKINLRKFLHKIFDELEFDKWIRLPLNISQIVRIYLIFGLQ